MKIHRCSLLNEKQQEEMIMNEEKRRERKNFENRSEADQCKERNKRKDR
jgi:hypothetical protein